MVINIIFLSVFLFGTNFYIINTEPLEDKQALLGFDRAIVPSPPLNWKESSSPCTKWIGVACNQENSRVVSLQLHGYHFRNPIPEYTIGRLTSLHILNLGSNSIPGPLPSDFSNLKELTKLYLESSNFSGPLPFGLSVLNNLSIINLSNNAFNGTISSSFWNLTHLTSLNLANNSFSGQLPDFSPPTLQVLDLSNNYLTGKIPQSLQKFPSWAFAGNKFGNSPPTRSPRQPPPVHPSKRSKKAEKIGIIIGGCSLVSIALMILLVVFYARKGDANADLTYSRKKNEGYKEKDSSIRENVNVNGNGKLLFFEGFDYVFDLEDLLRASAEVLGKGMFGTTYKAAMEDTNTVVVKRVKEESIAKRDFEHIMGLVGCIKHDNVAPLRAYYYSKEEKLMVYDYYSIGSVSVMLHAKRGEDRVPLEWETRLKITVGAARGIAHIHTHNNRKLVHGNVKSTNIFLNAQGYGSISDLGLAMLMSPTIPPFSQTSGYRAPEVTDSHKATQESDVYSFGVLLLELLTGKSPVYSTGGENDMVHLVRWVNSVVREEWTAEVFDIELMRYPNIEEEMVEMLQIGLLCTTQMPEQRPRMTDVLTRVENIRRVCGENPSSSESFSGRSTPMMADIGSSSLA